MVRFNYHVQHDVFFACDLFHLNLDHHPDLISRLFQSVFVTEGWVPPQIKSKVKKNQTHEHANNVKVFHIEVHGRIRRLYLMENK